MIDEVGVPGRGVGDEGAAVGYGVWRWGHKTYWSALVAFVAVTLSFRLGFGYLSWIGTFCDFADVKGPFFTNAKYMRDVIGYTLASGMVVLGTIVGVAVSTPALRQLRYSVATLLASAGVGGIVCAVMVAQERLGGSAFYDVVYAMIGCIAWLGLVGAAIGYGLSQYVPQPWERKR